MTIDYEFIVNVIGLYPTISSTKEVCVALDEIWDNTQQLRQEGVGLLESAVQARVMWLEKYLKDNQ